MHGSLIDVVSVEYTISKIFQGTRPGNEKKVFGAVESFPNQKQIPALLATSPSHGILDISMEMGNQKQLRYNLFFLLMLCFAAAILGDSTAEALLLAHLGPSVIPRMFLVNAAVLFILSAGLLSSVDRIDRRTFFLRAFLVHGFILILLRIAVAAEWHFLFLPLFSYAYSSKILFFMLFWTVANDLIDSRRAGKEFPFIAAGGTIGAIGISFSIPFLMRYISVENLLLVWVLLIAGGCLLLLPLRSHYFRLVKIHSSQRSESTRSGAGQSFLSLLHNEPLLQSMSVLYFLVFFLLLNQHIMFYERLKEAFNSASAIAIFLGHFNGVSMLVTCMLQVGIAGLLLRKLGSTRSMLLLPTALLIVFVALVVINSVAIDKGSLLFTTVIVGMGVRVAFFDAFFSPNFQLFFSSLPRHIRGRGKLLIEGVVKPLAMVVAGCWLLLVVPRLSLHVHLIIMITVTLFAVYHTCRLKNAYAKTLTRYLSGVSAVKNNSLLEQLEFSGDGDVLAFLADQLEHEDFEVQKFLIEIIASVATREAAAFLVEYLHQTEGKLKATIAMACGNFPEDMVAIHLRRCLSDGDSRVVANAALALSGCGADNLEESLIPLLEHHDSRVRANTIFSLWPYSGDAEKERFVGMLKRMIESASSEDCASALYVTGELNDNRVTELLLSFCRSKSDDGFNSEVVQRQAVRALGKTATPAAFELLLQLARTFSSQQKKLIVNEITTILPEIDEKLWCNGLSKGNAMYRNCLLQGLRKADLVFSTDALRILNRIAKREIEAIEWEKKSLQVLSNSGSNRMALLFYAIREELIAIRLDTLFHLIALLDTSGVVASVIPRIDHTDPHVRARALEVLENTGDEKINRSIINTIEWLDALQPHPDENGMPVQKKEIMVAATYSVSHNEWVATCADYACKAPEHF